ncbi:hypothetical protein [Collimonas antrihumi]|uniref:hypothetical protein n=1 Tax=Collimonas antrihumi TaxID=1940615 RepID=UPI001B8C0FB6|nr:hypothetical protein [Collimonas antrihumi]
MVADFGSNKYALGDALNIGTVITDGGYDRFKLLTAYEDKLLPGSELMADTLRSVSKHELSGSDAFDDAFARLEMALAFGYVERINGPGTGLYWVPPGLFLNKRELRESLLSSWRADYEARSLQSDLCVMARLKQPPRFDDVEERWDR